MKYISALMLVAMATIASCESIQMTELTPAVGSDSVCEVSLWCQDYATAERCGKVAYCRKWIWSDTMGTSEPATTCDECKKIVGELLSDNATIISEVCGLLPIFQQQCKDFLNKEIKGLTAQEVCHAIDMCPQSLAMKARHALENWLSKYQTQPEIDLCPICKELVKEVLNNTDAVKTILDDVCKKTPVAAECDLVVDALVEELSKMNATYICTELRACSQVSQQLLGGDMCTRGPSYWCASLGNANECQAFEYCSTMYWV